MHRWAQEDTSHCWLHPSIEVRASRIEGSGLFATAPLPEGTVVARLGGRFVSDDELTSILTRAAIGPTAGYVDTIMVDTNMHLVLPPGEPIQYGNHSCDPNLWYLDPLSFATMRAVEAGEELTNDYATTTGMPDWHMRCRCGSRDCRGRVRGSDWRLPELQSRYGEHWTPGLRRRIARA